jgi:major membrane immunogen (membrane-anchored lipoprotein)
MRKSQKLLVILLLIGLMVTSGCANNKKVGDNIKKVDTKVTVETKTKEIKYKDGNYEVKTEKDAEGFYCKAKVTIKDKKITNVEWNIYDFEDRVFDETYEEVYSGEPKYQKQCRNDLKGAITYGPKLMETQDIKKVDSISGATWSNKNFKKAINLALQKASM